ncbi:MAG: hypothetical protein ACI9VR_001498 [Cognaticolwellia sp.]|jgi:hypothetical protein
MYLLLLLVFAQWPAQIEPIEEQGSKRFPYGLVAGLECVPSQGLQVCSSQDIVVRALLPHEQPKASRMGVGGANLSENADLTGGVPGRGGDAGLALGSTGWIPRRAALR